LPAPDREETHAREKKTPRSDVAPARPTQDSMESVIQH